jgi:spore coat polysaccharide biosynthesis protein SpsF
MRVDNIVSKDFHTVAIIQARMTSSRLPGKVLADICGKPSLQHMLERVSRAEKVNSIVVATTVNTTDDPIVELCDQLGYKVFRGDELDVLGRFLQAAEAESAEAVVRLTADCPMIDPIIIDKVILKYSSGRFDYVSNCNERTYPDGLDVEIFSIDALLEANQKATSIFCREHVTPYIRGIHTQFETGNFLIGHVRFLTDLSHIRWTIDTIDDLERVRDLIKRLPDNYSWLDALSISTKIPNLLGPMLKSDAE